MEAPTEPTTIVLDSACCDNCAEYVGLFVGLTEARNAVEAAADRLVEADTKALHSVIDLINADGNVSALQRDAAVSLYGVMKGMNAHLITELSRAHYEADRLEELIGSYEHTCEHAAA